MSECNTTSCSFFFNSEYILLDLILVVDFKTLIQSYPRKIFENCRRNNKRVKRLDISNGKTIATSSLWISTRHNQLKAWKLLNRQARSKNPTRDWFKKKENTLKQITVFRFNDRNKSSNAISKQQHAARILYDYCGQFRVHAEWRLHSNTTRSTTRCG